MLIEEHWFEESHSITEVIETDSIPETEARVIVQVTVSGSAPQEAAKPRRARVRVKTRRSP